MDLWHTISDLDSNSSSKTVFGLRPNSTYYFRVYAVNALGPGKSDGRIFSYKFLRVGKVKDLLAFYTADDECL